MEGQLVYRFLAITKLDNWQEEIDKAAVDGWRLVSYYVTHTEIGSVLQYVAVLGKPAEEVEWLSTADEAQVADDADDPEYVAK